MQVKSVTSFKENPFSAFQVQAQPTVKQTQVAQNPITPQVSVAAPIQQAPAIQPAPAIVPAVAPQITPATAQATQATLKPKTDNMTKIAAIGAVALSAAAVGLSIAQGKKIKNLSSEIGDAVKKSIGEEVEKKVAEKLTSATEEITKNVSESVAKNNNKLWKVLEGLGFALAGSEIIDVIKSIKTKDGEVDSEVKDIQDKVTAKQSDVIKTAVAENSQSTKTIDLDPGVVKMLKTEATKRMTGQFDWPEIKNPQAWMVTSEACAFMKAGGLAEVANQLPDAYNEKFANDPDKKMTIVTPMYTKETTPDGTFTLTANEDGTYSYTGASVDGTTSTITLTKEPDQTIKTYNTNTKNFEEEKFEVYKGVHNGTEFLFMKNDKYFGIDPKEGKKSGPYIQNESGVKETERFAMFSKAAVELMKNAHEGKAGDVTAPNVILANDWHAGTMLPLMRYTIPTQASKNEVSEDTAKYFASTPVALITHNALFTGENNRETEPEIADKIVNTLFEDHTESICQAIQGSGANGSFPISTGMGTYNPYLAGANLADIVIGVSRNYATELPKAGDIGGTAYNVFQTRSNAKKDSSVNKTLTGIINGYDKTKASPNEVMINGGKNEQTGKTIKGINDIPQVDPNAKFQPYAALKGSEAYKVKTENKKALAQLLNNLAKNGGIGTKEKMSAKLYKADQCEVPTGEDFVNAPVICDVGRMTEQKGFDYLAKAIKSCAESNSDSKNFPVFIVLGSGETQADQDKYVKPLQELKDELLKTNPEIGKRMFIFEGYDGNLRDAIYCGSDFTAIPSKWEPCGLTQMESMAKGTIPVVLASGGLADTVKQGETGFVSSKFYAHRSNDIIYDGKNTTDSPLSPRNNEEAFSVTLDQAIKTFNKDKAKIEKMSTNCMNQDFSWDVSGSLDEYSRLMQTGKTEPTKTFNA